MSLTTLTQQDKAWQDQPTASILLMALLLLRAKLDLK